LRQAVHGDMEKLLDEVTGAVNTAPDGAVISGSEEAVRDAMRCPNIKRWFFGKLSTRPSTLSHLKL